MVQKLSKVNHLACWWMVRWPALCLRCEFWCMCDKHTYWETGSYRELPTEPRIWQLCVSATWRTIVSIIFMAAMDTSLSTHALVHARILRNISISCYSIPLSIFFGDGNPKIIVFVNSQLKEAGILRCLSLTMNYRGGLLRCPPIKNSCIQKIRNFFIWRQTLY